MTNQDASADVRAVIRRINSAWLDGPADAITTALLPCFDESVVFCGPTFQAVARGATACAASYEQFVRTATVRDFDAPAPDIHVAGETATAVCPWTMTYTLDEATYTESGHDLLVLTRRGGEWRVMWRALVPASTS